MRWIICLFLLIGNAWAAEVRLAWDANSEPDLAGYRIHYGTASGSYTVHVDVGNVTTYTVPGLADGVRYYFAATAYNATYESGYSNEVNWISGESPVYIGATAIRASKLQQQAEQSMVIAYDAMWNGDYPSQSWYVYTDGGTGTPIAGTYNDGNHADLSSDPGTDSTDGGWGMKFAGEGHGFAIPITAKNFFDSAQGTISGEFYVTNDGTDGACYILEGYEDWNQRFYLRVNADRTFTVLHNSSKNSGSAVTCTSSAVMSEGTWNTFEIAWNASGNVRGSGATNYIGIKLNDGSYEYFTTAIKAFSTEPASIFVGDGSNSYGADVFYIDALKFWVTDQIEESGASAVPVFMYHYMNH